jgi:hypothetical protein
VGSQLLGGKVAAHQAEGGRTDHGRIRRRQALETGRKIGRLPQRQLFLATAAPDFAHYHQAGMDPHPHGQLDPLLLLQSAVERRRGLHHGQPGAYRSLRIVLMRLRIAKVDEQAIAEILGNVALEALDDRGTGLLIGTHHLAVVFRIELTGEGSRVHQITE